MLNWDWYRATDLVLEFPVEAVIMGQKKQKQMYFAVIMISLVALLSGKVLWKTEIDHKTLIEKDISRQYNKTKQIEIFTEQNLKHYTITGFTLTGEESAKAGIAVIKEEDNSKPELIKTYRFEKLTKRAQDIYVAYVDLFQEEKEQYPYLAVISTNPALSLITMNFDNNTANQLKVDGNPSLTMIEFPDETAGGEYQFFDAAGNVIN